MTKEEALKAIADFSARKEEAQDLYGGVMFAGESGKAYAYPSRQIAGEFPKLEDAHFYVTARCHADTLLTLARAGAAVMFPSEEEVFDLTYAAQHLRDVAGLSVFPADSSWPARLREIADMIAAMKPEPSHDPS